MQKTGMQLVLEDSWFYLFLYEIFWLYLTSLLIYNLHKLITIVRLKKLFATKAQSS